MNKEGCSCKNSHSPISQNSFLWGLIVGGLIVFLLVTKKGRRILKAISEEGFEKLGEYVDIEKLSRLKQDFEDEVDEDGFEGVDPDSTPIKSGSIGVEAEVKQENGNAKKRRFFRRKKS